MEVTKCGLAGGIGRERMHKRTHTRSSTAQATSVSLGSQHLASEKGHCRCLQLAGCMPGPATHWTGVR
eukprot:scaffold45440_cov23-Tisochrysis_lutea.AAC.3